MSPSSSSSRGPRLGLAGIVLCAAACSSTGPTPTSVVIEPDVAPGPRQLELAVPERSVRQPQPPGTAPVAFVPRTIGHSLTATIVLRDESLAAPLSIETFRLSPERVSVTDEAGAEWWLGRNPLFPEELSGQQTSPRERLVLVHSAGDLRMTGSEQLWDSIASLGGPGAPTAGLLPTQRTETAFGLQFTEWLARDDSSPLRQVWWNEREGWALRSRAVVGGRSLLREIATLEWSVDDELLREPLQRHPDWERSTLSDLEGLHEHGREAATR